MDRRALSPEKATRPGIGLALGGGVVRGLAHVGVLSVLVREGIPIDYVAGTSVGALIGAFFCAGMDPAEMAYVAEKVGWRDLARPVWPTSGLLSFARMEEMLRALLGDVTFADLDIPFVIVASELGSGREVLLDTGKLAPAVRASCSVPGVVVPRRINGCELADGGIVNNLPASIVRGMGASYVIGVDVFEPNYYRRGGPLGKLATALEILVNRAGGGIDDVDCLIRPKLGGQTYVLFSKRETLIQRGREAAERVMPDLKAALGVPRGRTTTN